MFDCEFLNIRTPCVVNSRNFTGLLWQYVDSSLDAKADARYAQILISSMRWNIGMFIGLAGLIIALV